MKRINGYLDLDEYFKRLLKTTNINRDVLENKKIIRQEFGGVNSMFWFKYFGVDILFKLYENEYNIFSELLSEELAKYLDIKTAQYDAATFEGRKGVITYDFKKEKYKYVSLGDILDWYTEKIVNDEDETNTYGEFYLREYNKREKDYVITNLEDIWNALEAYLKQEIFDLNIIPDIVEKLMSQLTDYFGYQIISGNYDMHSGNISIGISYARSDAILSPLYDNEDMFKQLNIINYDYPSTPRLMLERGNLESDTNALKMLENYLSVSDSYFVGRFKNMINQLDENTIYQLLKNVEEKIEIEVQENIKEKLIKNFNANLRAINNLLESFEYER